MAESSQQSGDRRSRVGSLLRSASGAVGAVGRATGVTRTRGQAVEQTATPKKAAAARTTATKKAAKKTATKKTATKKTALKKPAAKTTATKKAAPAPKVAAKKTVAKKAAATKTDIKNPPATPASAPRKKVAVSTATPTNSAAKRPAKSTANKQAAADLVVRDEESPWTSAELAEVRTELTAEIERFRTELKSIEAEIAGLIHDDNGGAGDDQADVGSKALEREYEYSLASANRASMEQAGRALARIDDGTYGICEGCGNPIGKLRLQAFPRATLCMQCKQKQERR